MFISLLVDFPKRKRVVDVLYLRVIEMKKVTEVHEAVEYRAEYRADR